MQADGFGGLDVGGHVVDEKGIACIELITLQKQPVNFGVGLCAVLIAGNDAAVKQAEKIIAGKHGFPGFFMEIG